MEAWQIPAKSASCPTACWMPFWITGSSGTFSEEKASVRSAQRIIYRPGGWPDSRQPKRGTGVLHKPLILSKACGQGCLGRIDHKHHLDRRALCAKKNPKSALRPKPDGMTRFVASGDRGARWGRVRHVLVDSRPVSNAKCGHDGAWPSRWRHNMRAQWTHDTPW